MHWQKKYGDHKTTFILGFAVAILYLVDSSFFTFFSILPFQNCVFGFWNGRGWKKKQFGFRKPKKIPSFISKSGKKDDERNLKMKRIALRNVKVEIHISML